MPFNETPHDIAFLILREVALRDPYSLPALALSCPAFHTAYTENKGTLLRIRFYAIAHYHGTIALELTTVEYPATLPPTTEANVHEGAEADTTNDPALYQQAIALHQRVDRFASTLRRLWFSYGRLFVHDFGPAESQFDFIQALYVYTLHDLPMERDVSKEIALVLQTFFGSLHKRHLVLSKEMELCDSCIRTEDCDDIADTTETGRRLAKVRHRFREREYWRVVAGLLGVFEKTWGWMVPERGRGIGYWKAEQKDGLRDWYWDRAGRLEELLEDVEVGEGDPEGVFCSQRIYF